MAGALIAERLVDEPTEGAGGPARYALYAAAAAAALVGAWLIAGPALTSTPATNASAPMTARTAPMPVADNVRQIDMSQRSTPEAPVAPAAAPASAPRSEAALDTSEQPIPPKPQPRPVRPSVAAQSAPVQPRPVVRAAEPAVRAAEPATVQTGAPPADLGVLREPAAPAYVVPAVNPVPAAPAIQSAAANGPVPPMPVDDVANVQAPPANEPVHHQGLLGATERAAGTVWNWTTGAVGNTVRTVQQGF